MFVSRNRGEPMSATQTEVEAERRMKLLRGSMAVVTRHGKKIHLWAGGKPPASTVCGLELIDFAPDAAPEYANCSRCVERIRQEKHSTSQASSVQPEARNVGS